MASRQKKKRYDKKSNRTRQKNETADGKLESNESPEIPDREETSDIQASLRGASSGRLGSAALIGSQSRRRTTLF